MQKYRRVREMVQNKVAKFTAEERQLVQSEFRVSPLVTMADLAGTHSPSYIDRFLNGNQTDLELRNVGFPWSLQGVNRTLSSVGGTVAAATSICDLRRLQIKARQHKDDTDNKDRHDARNTTRNQHRTTTAAHPSPPLPPLPPPPPLWGAHLAGGTHHAFHDRGEGFCIFSDIAVAADVLLRRYPDLVQNVLVLDLDVHQGNGNAVLFAGRDDVFTFSLHCRDNYFSRREVVGDLDVELPPGCDDATYLATLHHWLGRIAREAHRRSSAHGDDVVGRQQPFDFIFYQAGVDILEEDRLGRMALTRDGVKRRNEMVFQFAYNMDAPLCITMGGGYPKHDNDWSPILDAHTDVYVQALQFLARHS